MRESINKREVDRAAQVIIDSYAVDAVERATELELASGGSEFAKAVRAKVEALLRSREQSKNKAKRP